jgi:hypothetical protein
MTAALPKLKFKILRYVPFVWAFEYKRRRACGFLLNSCRNILDITVLFRSRYFFLGETVKNSFFYCDVLQDFPQVIYSSLSSLFEDSVKIFSQTLVANNTPQCSRETLIKKKIKFSSYIRKFRMEHAVAKSFMTNGLLIYREIFVHFLIYWEALPHI